MSSIENIENLTRSYATARSHLGELLGALEADIIALRRRRIRGIRAALAKAQDAQAAVVKEVSAHPELFVKPRSITVDGIRVGIQKGKGAIEWDDDALVCKLIRRHLADEAELLIKVTEKPIKGALKNLTVSELRKIGCTVQESGDEVFLKPQDSELDKLMKRILKEAQSVEEGA